MALSGSTVARSGSTLAFCGFLSGEFVFFENVMSFSDGEMGATVALLCV